MQKPSSERGKCPNLSASHVSRKSGCFSIFSGLAPAHYEVDIAQEALLVISL